MTGHNSSLVSQTSKRSLLTLCLVPMLALTACDEEPREPRSDGAADDEGWDTEDMDDESTGDDVEYAGAYWSDSRYRTFPDAHGNPHRCYVNLFTETLTNGGYEMDGTWVPRGTQRTLANFGITCGQGRLILRWRDRFGVERTGWYHQHEFVDMNLPEITVDTAPNDTLLEIKFCVNDPNRTHCTSMWRP